MPTEIFLNPFRRGERATIPVGSRVSEPLAFQPSCPFPPEMGTPLWDVERVAFLLGSPLPEGPFTSVVLGMCRRPNSGPSLQLAWQICPVWVPKAEAGFLRRSVLGTA